MPINTFQDILDALEREPALRDALRHQLLSEDILALPAQIARLAENVVALTNALESLTQRFEEFVALTQEQNLATAQRLDRLESSVTELQTGQARMGGQVSHLMGADYQGIVTRIANRLVNRHLNVRDAYLVAHARDNGGNPVQDRNNEAIRSGAITADQALDLELADAVLLGTGADGSSVYVLAEASITVQEGDIAIAKRRADILHRVTGAVVIPAAIGTAITPEAAASADAEEVAFIPFSNPSGDPPV